MTTFKLVGKLLKFKGFRCVGLAFRRGNRLDVLVKPFKNGCRCPECGRRGTIVRRRPEPRYWRDIPRRTLVNLADVLAARDSLRHPRPGHRTPALGR